MTKTLCLAALLFTGCTSDEPTTSSTARAILDGSTCNADADCPASFECDDNVCQAHDEDTSCPADCDDAEHDGQKYCDPHGDDSDGTGTGAVGATCASAADCAPGSRCKTEWTGHGESVSTCEPHGSDDTGTDDHGGHGTDDTGTDI